MDYYIRRVVISDLFESGNNYRIDFSEGCNCIFGPNGTGKTTIINLIVNSLSVDLEPLSRISFGSITVFLAKTGQVRAFRYLHLSRRRKLQGVVNLYYEFESAVTYAFEMKLRGGVAKISERLDENPPEELRDKIRERLNLTHVPLLRMHDSEINMSRDSGDEFLQTMLRQKHISQSQITEILDPSVKVLNSLERQFVSEANSARKKITEKLDDLRSKIIEKVMIDESLVRLSNRALSRAHKAMNSDFLEDVDVSAYVRKLSEAQINVPEVKIKEHFSIWKQLNDNVRDAFKIMRSLGTSEKGMKKHNEAAAKFNSSYYNLIAMSNFNDRFLSIVEDVELMQAARFEVTRVFSEYEKEVNLYLKPKKMFHVSEDGELSVMTRTSHIRLSDLSSGEKHIISILGRAALSRKEGAIFVADEPELSLHLDWQRMILPSIAKLSPKSQVIIATHSPAIRMRGAKDIDLEECMV
ncbi:hypothetical protein PS718_04014 [Pseudomonas fluorescens]|uniref:Endonuclease GajA/Old nuclease/RecF-like AAA domain-containing protein n=1 Tax=Pseudomonas fluorescens TaxID=294 RepID=A0A5E7DXD1_PSEFL|nr:AAA family ATPase [Pseudomonas fluorescens]VVO18448.1 hypothetical protein PS718_04014 [Pseudomonas fluorescens]